MFCQFPYCQFHAKILFCHLIARLTLNSTFIYFISSKPLKLDFTDYTLYNWKRINDFQRAFYRGVLNKRLHVLYGQSLVFIKTWPLVKYLTLDLTASNLSVTTESPRSPDGQIEEESEETEVEGRGEEEGNSILPKECGTSVGGVSRVVGGSNATLGEQNWTLNSLRFLSICIFWKLIRYVWASAPMR